LSSGPFRPRVRPRDVNFLTNAASAASGIFIPLYAMGLRASPDQIGFIIAAFNAFVLFSSFVFGRAADIQGARKVLRGGLLFSAAAALTQPLAFDPLSLAASRALLGFAVGMYPAALLAYAKTADSLMGKFASYGSLGWGLGNLAAGLASYFVPGTFWPVFALSSASWFLAFLFATAAPLSETGTLRIPLPARTVIRRNLSVYLMMLIRHTGANMVWAIFPLFLSASRGLSEVEIAIVYAFNPFVQFAVMQRIDRYRSGWLIGVGLAGSSVTFLLFLVAWDFWTMMAVQILLGTSWATLYVGSLKLITETNRETATAGGLFNSTLSLSSIVGPVLGGYLATTGYEAPMVAASILSAAALGLHGVEARLRARTRAPSGPSPGS